MNENTIRHLVEILGIALENRTAKQDLDIPALRAALTNAIQEATGLHPDPRVQNEDLRKLVTDVVRKEFPRGGY